MRLRRLSGDAMQLRRSAAAAEGSQWKSEQDATARECDGAGQRLVLLCCGEHGVRLARVVVIQCVGARTRNH